MKYTEMRVTSNAPVWGAPEAFLHFIQDLLNRGPVLIVLDETSEGTIQKVDEKGEPDAEQG